MHTHSVRIYYEDTDFSGFVYHAAYIRFFERGRSEYIRKLGIHHSSLLAGDYGKPAFFAVHTLNVHFYAPAKIDDVLEVRTFIIEKTGARLKLQQGIYKDEYLLVEAKVKVVCLHATTHKPIRFPKF